MKYSESFLFSDYSWFFWISFHETAGSISHLFDSPSFFHMSAPLLYLVFVPQDNSASSDFFHNIYSIHFALRDLLLPDHPSYITLFLLLENFQNVSFLFYHWVEPKIPFLKVPIRWHPDQKTIAPSVDISLSILHHQILFHQDPIPDSVPRSLLL